MFRTMTVAVALLTLAFGAAAEDAAGAAKKAVAYLVKSQNDDGTFGNSQQSKLPGIVGLTLRSLTTSPDKLREDNPAVAKAVKYLLAHQQANGSFVIEGFGLENYNTACAAYGIATLENPAHKDALEKAKNFILKCQLDDEEGIKPSDPTHGAFSYGGKNINGDLSNTAFSMDALKAMGLKEDSPAWKNAVKFIQRCQENEETNDLPEVKGSDNSGGFIYKPGKSEFGTYTAKNGKQYQKPYGNMTYMAVKSLIYAGVKKDDPALQAAMKWIKNNYTVEKPAGGNGMQGYYFYVNAFAKAFTAAGIKEVELADGTKANWARDLSARLIALQKPDGSFVNDEKRWMESDPVLATAYALDALNFCVQAMK